MARRSLLAVVLCAGAACGASPAAPAVSTPVFALAAGAHTLNIQTAPTTTTGPNGIVMSVMLCIGTGTSSVRLPVDVRREDNRWIVAPAAGTLRMELVDVQGGVEGSAGGRATHDGITVTVQAAPDDPAAASVAAAPGRSSLGGTIEGDVTYVSEQGWHSCSGNAWSLSPR